ncbi:TIGR02285 family protein [Pseudoalteromonas shioyasakiensis]|uniref:TIGR02285 family protein n=1 Tax=Pseudoalteromonas shioyasakiensis TaxID=1190813 RepID=UPI0021177A5F|nr:TIGR02285 family protein [Pseudoalteromonas shioyasakiensis]MCQ8876990.1 TIGR02285 family protein [Pseudoalteromonas shioyasakiensis]
MLRILIFVTTCGFMALHVQSKTIDWVVVDFAPYYILNGQYEGTGRDESVITLLEAQLPNYTFNRVILPSSRALQEVSNPNKTLCMLSLYQSEHRRQHIAFSEESSTTGLSPSLAIHKELLTKLNINANKPLSFSHLLNDKKLTLGISMSRSYGVEIDKIINSSADASIIIRPGRDTLASLTYMLKKKRIDILLGYPSEHFYMAKSMAYEDELTQIQLTEAAKLSDGYIGCTDTTLGNEHINVLNEALIAVKQQQAYNDILLRWLPDNLRPVLAQRLQKNASRK